MLTSQHLDVQTTENKMLVGLFCRGTDKQEYNPVSLLLRKVTMSATTEKSSIPHGLLNNNHLVRSKFTALFTED
jgi:hypothetical protein